MRLLDRYVIRNFLQAYVYCIAAFLSIWLIFDVSDNVSTIIDQHVSPLAVLAYYGTQLPQVLVILLPVSLLLALLFSLGRMSRSNEIVSMLTAGVSIPRLLLPLIAVGLVTTAASTALNYALAPHAELARKAFLDNGVRKEGAMVNAQIFRNRTDNRTWYIQGFRPGENRFENVQIIQQNEQDEVVANYLATRVHYLPASKSWELELVKVVHYDAVGNIRDEAITPSITITDWSETPFRLTSASARAESLSFPELRDYVRLNFDFPRTLLAPFWTHLYYRIALPWTCLIVIFIAAPLGIGYSRRGILSSVAVAIFLVFAMNFLTHFFLALGEGDRIPASIAAWTPNAIFAVIGAYLLYLRSTNREPPRLESFLPWRIFAR